MKRFVEGVDRSQSSMFPERLEDWIGEDNPVRVVDVFVDELDLGGLGFGRVEPRETGRPGYHPSVLLKLYIYGYLNRVGSTPALRGCDTIDRYYDTGEGQLPATNGLSMAPRARSAYRSESGQSSQLLGRTMISS